MRTGELWNGEARDVDLGLLGPSSTATMRLDDGRVVTVEYGSRFSLTHHLTITIDFADTSDGVTVYDPGGDEVTTIIPPSKERP